MILKELRSFLGSAEMQRRAALFPATIAGAGFLLLAGCAVGPDYRTPEIETPQGYETLNREDLRRGERSKSREADKVSSAANPQVDEAETNLDRWWEKFSDPALNELIDYAVGSEDSPWSFDLRIAAARVLEARAQIQIAQASWFPNLRASSSIQRSRISTNSLIGSSVGSSGGGFNFLPGLTNTLYSVGFDSAWELDFFGKTRRAVESQRALTEATEESYHQVMLTLVAEIARNYVEYRAAEERIAANDRNIAAQEQSLSLTRSRFKAGMTSELDVFQAESQAATTESLKPPLVLARDQARNRLAVLLGEYPAFVSKFFESHPGKVPDDIQFLPRSLPSDLLRKRPDVKAAERQLAAASARIGVATAQFFPTFSLAVAGSFQSQQSKNWLDYSSRSWSLLPSVSLPIFEGGRLSGSLHAANADERVAFETYRQSVFASVEDVENAISKYAQDQKRFHSLSRALAANQQSMNISQKLYSEGLADFLRVLDAERSLYTTEDQVIATKASRVTSLIALFKALGGGWSEPAASKKS